MRVEVEYNSSGQIAFKRHLGNFAVITETNQSTQETYLFHDHLGSVDVITDKQGNALQYMSFSAWGERRAPANWQDIPATLSRDYLSPKDLPAMKCSMPLASLTWVAASTMPSSVKCYRPTQWYKTPIPRKASTAIHMCTITRCHLPTQQGIFHCGNYWLRWFLLWSPSLQHLLGHFWQVS